jgi:hypothetical protein
VDEKAERVKLKAESWVWEAECGCVSPQRTQRRRKERKEELEGRSWKLEAGVGVECVCGYYTERHREGKEGHKAESKPLFSSFETVH